ncbi:MAG: Amuc_1100 family pilus-like protein [Lacunisphaera sp.]|jgi:hypothetical protein|nr:Amuc_1100 family pilus-like protein [Lacunisphaera sp.]
MSWLKRHPLLGAVLACGVLALAAEAWFLRQARQQAARAVAGLEQKIQERDWLARQAPAPSAASEQAIARDLLQTRQELARLRDALQPRSGQAETEGLPATSKPIDEYFAIAAFVEKTRALAVRARVVLKPDERFGLAAHANEGPEPDLLPAVFRQRRVLQYLVDALLEARPQALLLVQRERPLTPAQRAQRNQAAQPAGSTVGGAAGSDFFAVADLGSLRRPGRVESEGFRLEFTGRTPALRAFLNSLASGPRPVIVRQVEVERVTTDAGFSAAPTADAPVPLVAQNLSKFAVVVECVELLPAPEPSTP